MPQTVQIRDIMIREVVTVSPQTSIVEVANLLRHRNFHAVPVVDQDQHVLGIITETDFFLKDAVVLHLPTYVEVVSRNLGKETTRISKEVPEFQQLMNACAEDIMTKHCIILPEVADVRDMIALVRMHHFKTFPVVSPSGILTGVVSLIDVVSVLGSLLNKKCI